MAVMVTAFSVYLEDSQDPEPGDMDQRHRGTRYKHSQLVHHLVPVHQSTNQSTVNRDYIIHKPSILVPLVQTQSPQPGVAIVEQLIQSLVDHVFSYVHTKQWYHVLDEVRDVLQMTDVVVGLSFIEKLEF